VTNGKWTADQTPNLNIDVHADFQVVPDSPNFFFQFQVTDLSYAPLSIGGSTRGLAVQNDPIALQAPYGETLELAPDFRWSFTGNTPQDNRIYISTAGPGEGLFPDDGSAGASGANRIVDGAAATSFDPNSGLYTYTLPAGITLTPGQT
jgi:hypothetical protein